MMIPELFETGFIVGFLLGGGATILITYIIKKLEGYR